MVIYTGIVFRKMILTLKGNPDYKCIEKHIWHNTYIMKIGSTSLKFPSLSVNNSRYKIQRVRIYFLLFYLQETSLKTEEILFFLFQ